MAFSSAARPGVINIIIDARYHRVGLRHIDMPATCAASVSVTTRDAKRGYRLHRHALFFCFTL